MALLWADGFDIYGTDETRLAQNGYVESVGVDVFNSGGRTGPGYLQCDGTTNTYSISRPLDAAVTTFGIGLAVYPITYSTSTSNLAGPSVGGIRIGWNDSQGITIRSATGQLSFSANNIIPANTWYWIETKFVNNGDGTADVTVRLNGQIVVQANGIAVSGSTFGSWQIYIGNGGALTRYDDLVIWDDSGTINNDFLGDRRCVTTYPDADSVTQEWTGVGATPNYNCIDDVLSDATYIEATANGQISEFERTPISIDSDDIAGIFLMTRNLKADSGSTGFRVGLNSNGNVSNSARILPNTTPGYAHFMLELNPDGNVPWTRASADAALVRFTRDDP